jgi:predicted nucleic acid-binding protein
VSANEVVVDASLALKWAIEEPDSARALALLEDWRNQGRVLIAPPLFLYEVANVLAKRMRRGQFTLEQVTERMRFFLESGPRLHHIGTTHLRALELVERLHLSTAYDAHYVALAEVRRCECWTADERLWNSVKRQLPMVRWIGEL